MLQGRWGKCVFHNFVGFEKCEVCFNHFSPVVVNQVNGIAPYPRHFNDVTEVEQLYHTKTSFLSSCVKLFIVDPFMSCGFDVIDKVVYLCLDVINDCVICVQYS